MITNFTLMFAHEDGGISGSADYGRDVLTLEISGEPVEFSLSHARHVLDKPYHATEPEEGWKISFTREEKRKLRPIAETLAMLDGNALFGMDAGDGKEWYESYLSEAHAIYEANGGDSGWAGEASFAKGPRTRPSWLERLKRRMVQMSI